MAIRAGCYRKKSTLSEAIDSLETAEKEIRRLRESGVDDLEHLDGQVSDALITVRDVMDDMDNLLDDLRDLASYQYLA